MEVHRNEKYQGQDVLDERISCLKKMIYDANMVKKIFEEELDRIQKDCKHEYYLTCTGTYEDCYQCILCGKEEWF